MRVVGIVAPLAPRGVSIRENSFYGAPGGKWAQETCAGCPQQRYATGEAGKVQGWDHVGIVEWFCGNWARGVSIRGKFVLSIRLGYKTSHHVTKRSSEPRVAYPKVKVQVRDRVRVVRIVSPFAPRGVSIQGVNGHRRPSAGGPEQLYATGEPGKVQGRDRVGIVERSRVKGPLGSVFGENLFYRETQDTRPGGRHVAKRSSDPRVAYPEVNIRGKFVLSSPRE